MKSFKSAVFTVAAALFLVVSFSGCKDNDAQTAVNNGENKESFVAMAPQEGVPNSDGMSNFILPQGVSSLEISFKTRELFRTSQSHIHQLLAEAGVEEIDSMDLPMNISLFVNIKPVEKKLVISLPSSIKTVKASTSSGRVGFEWNYVEGFVWDARA